MSVACCSLLTCECVIQELKEHEVIVFAEPSESV